MGIVERKEKQKQEIHKQILEASMRLFVEQGFANVSIRKIADLIEYSPTTVYLYFKDKDEILFELHKIGFFLLDAMNEGLPSIQDPLLRLHKLGENYLDFGMKHPEYYDLMFMQPSPMVTLSEMECTDWKNGDAAMCVFRDTLNDCMEQGFIARTDPGILSMAIWSMVHGLVSLAISGRMEKFIPGKEYIRPVMAQSLNWIIDTIDISSGRSENAG
jgi:AcrR family transcriptional regulator